MQQYKSISANDSAFAFNTHATNQHGLTKREYFAAIALQGILSCNEPGKNLNPAQTAVRHADDLIKELDSELEFGK